MLAYCMPKKKEIPPFIEPQWFLPATNQGPMGLAPHRQCAIPKEMEGVAVEAKDSRNPQPPSTSNQVPTNHEGPGKCSLSLVGQVTTLSMGIICVFSFSFHLSSLLHGVKLTPMFALPQ
jgi:hypothetical protein